MSEPSIQKGDRMFIDPSKTPAQLRFLPWVEAGPEPERYGLDQNTIYEGRVESVGEAQGDHMIRRRDGELVDLAWYLDVQGYVLADK